MNRYSFGTKSNICGRMEDISARVKEVGNAESRMSNTSDKGTTFGDGAARVGMQLRSSPKALPTFGVPITTVDVEQGRNSFALCLIEVNFEADLVDVVTISIPSLLRYVYQRNHHDEYIMEAAQDGYM
ncbi:hypothetical protein Tco_0396420 [Tanacetum coccineum]